MLILLSQVEQRFLAWGKWWLLCTINNNHTQIEFINISLFTVEYVSVISFLLSHIYIHPSIENKLPNHIQKPPESNEAMSIFPFYFALTALECFLSFVIVVLWGSAWGPIALLGSQIWTVPSSSPPATRPSYNTEGARHAQNTRTRHLHHRVDTVQNFLSSALDLVNIKPIQAYALTENCSIRVLLLVSFKKTMHSKGQEFNPS